MTRIDTPPGSSKGSEGDLENHYKQSQINAARAQVVATIIAALAVFVALFVALQGQVTINHNTQTSLLQSQDSQLSTAITALGSDESAERVAGLVLLARNAAARFRLAPETRESPADVYDDYTTALQIFSGYLRNHSSLLLTGSGTAPAESTFGLGYGTPPRSGIPLDVTYAANQVQFMLTNDMQANVASLRVGIHPAIDLANDELYGQPWQNINFGWIYAWLRKIDLRGADLASSKWSQRSTLSYSYLQCANLQDADFRGANLTYADLRGANVEGADFRGAHLKGARIGQVYGDARWPRWMGKVSSLPATKWSQPACLRDSRLWDNQPSTSKGK